MAIIEFRLGRQARLAAVASLAAAALIAGTPGTPQAQTQPAPAPRAAPAPHPATPAPAPQAAAPQGGGAAAATEGDTETVEQRIASLHEALKITPAQEPKWQAVAKAMRENAAAMDKLMAESQAMDPEKMTAVQNLANYQKFARAQVAGLKNLTDDFRALYQAMPPDQKKVADQVFRTAG
jgi:hypothetical protein